MWLKLAVAWSALVGVLATTVFQIDYDNRFAEVHDMTRYVREQEGSVVIFRTGRPNSDVAISLDLNESAVYTAYHYLKRPAEMTDDLADVLQMEFPVWVITRRGRMLDDDIIGAMYLGYMVGRPETPFEQDKFELWKVELLPQRESTDFEAK